jgi:hypothetical protein
MPQQVRLIPPLGRTLGTPSDITNDPSNVHRRRSVVPSQGRDEPPARCLLGSGEVAQALEHDRVDPLHPVHPLLEILVPGPAGEGLGERAGEAETGQ